MSVFGYDKEESLIILDGVPGSGKSYCANIAQVDWLLSGNPVLTNLRINSLPKYHLGVRGEYVFLEEEDFQLGSSGRLGFLEKLEGVKERWPHSHILLVIDECHDIFNSRNWKENQKLGFTNWIAQHRKMNVSVMLITQDYGQIDKALRVRAQEFRTHTNLSKDSLWGLVLWIFGQNVHEAVSYPAKRGEPNFKRPHSIKAFRIKNNRAARRYSSGQMHRIGVADMFKAKGQAGRYLAIFLLCCVLLGVGSVGAAIKQAFSGSDPAGPSRKAGGYELVEVPPFEAEIQGAYLGRDGHVVLITEAGDLATTSTDIYEYEVGEKYVVERPPVPLRPYVADLIEVQHIDAGAGDRQLK